jgi:hypothetical protein
LDYDEINFETESEARYAFYIDVKKFQECPRTAIKIAGEVVSVILDTGCELTHTYLLTYSKEQSHS